MNYKSMLHMAVLALVFVSTVDAEESKQPNVVIVITDDQGYGDVAFTGNPAIKDSQH